MVVGADTNGAGGVTSDGPGRGAVAINEGAGQVVYEVVDSAPLNEQAVAIPVWLARLGDDVSSAGTVLTQVSFAPISTFNVADRAAPERRFVEAFVDGPTIEISRCIAANLAPVVDAGPDRSFEVAEGDTVTMTVRELNPRLEFRPRELRFDLPVDSPPATKSFSLQAIDGGLPYSIRPGGSWVSASPASGSLARDQTTAIQVTVDPTGLRSGTHSTRLFVRDGGDVVGQVAVALNLTGSGQPGPLPVPVVSLNGVVNAGSLSAQGQPGHPVAPGSMVSIFGSNFSEPGQHFEAIGTPLPTTLGGVTVRFNGIAAPLFGVWPNQINVQLPTGLDKAVLAKGDARVEQAGGVSITVETAAGVSDAGGVEVASFSPAIFTTTQDGTGQAVAVFNDTAILAAPEGAFGASRPASADDILAIYANGLGAVMPPLADGASSCSGKTCGPDTVLRHTVERPTVIIGGGAVPDEDLLFSGLAPEFVGVNLVIVRVSGFLLGGDSIPIQLEIGGVVSRDDVTIAVAEILKQ